MGLLTNKPTVVYLVEDHTDQEPKSHTAYWAHVYLSLDKAKAGVEDFSDRGGHGAVRWEKHSPVSYACRWHANEGVVQGGPAASAAG
jgi:hypothetical protein